VFAIGVTGHAARICGAVREEEGLGTIRLFLAGFDCGTDGGGGELGLGSGMWIQEELRGWIVVLLRILRGFVGDDDALAQGTAGDFAESGSFGGGGGMEAGYSAVEPEVGGGGWVGSGFEIFEVFEIKENADVETAGLVDEVVEIVEGAQGRVDGLGV